MSIQKTTTDLTTLKINYLTQQMYENALANDEINENELYFTPGSGLPYTTTAPTAANTDGLKIVLLSSEPETKYSGWIYLIQES